MNILADKQKELLSIKPYISDEIYSEKEKEYLKLYYELRNINDKKIYSKLTLEQRKKIHKFILITYKLKNKIGNFSYEILEDSREKTDRPIIFALTHIGKYDIEMTSEAIKDHYYLLSGDFEHIQGIIDAPFLALNGVIYFNEKIKEDRQLASKKMINHLKNNGNLMYFPEGTWNLSSNLPVLPCYWGIVDVAKKGNAIIVPIAVEQYNKHFKINIGKNFDMNVYGDNTIEKTKAINDLRDTLATLKWEIWETEPQINRMNLDLSIWDYYVDERFKEWPYFNNEYIEGMIYKPKNIFDSETVYAPIKKLVPNKNNAFLLNKRLKDDIFK